MILRSTKVVISYQAIQHVRLRTMYGTMYHVEVYMYILRSIFIVFTSALENLSCISFCCLYFFSQLFTVQQQCTPVAPGAWMVVQYFVVMVSYTWFLVMENGYLVPFCFLFLLSQTVSIRDASARLAAARAALGDKQRPKSINILHIFKSEIVRILPSWPFFFNVFPQSTVVSGYRTKVLSRSFTVAADYRGSVTVQIPWWLITAQA